MTNYIHFRADRCKKYGLFEKNSKRKLFKKIRKFAEIRKNNINISPPPGLITISPKIYLFSKNR